MLLRAETFTIRSFINNLNKDLYKVIYVSAYDNLTLFDFYKEISNSLNLDTKACYKTDMYNNIQKAIKRLVEIFFKHNIPIDTIYHNLGLTENIYDKNLVKDYYN